MSATRGVDMDARHGYTGPGQQVVPNLPDPRLRMRQHLARLPLVWGAALFVTAALASPSALAGQLRPTSMVAADGAQRALAAAEAEARQQKWAVSIAVVDAAGELVAFLRMDGAPFSSIDVARAKARTAARFRRPTRALDSALTAGRLAILGLEGATPVEGGVPIIVGGEVVGAVGVSGVTSAQDAQVAQAGVRAVTP